MSKLEDTVRHLLEGAAPEPPAGSGPAQEPAVRRRRSSAPLWAAAVILGLAALLFGRHATDSTPAASTTAPAAEHAHAPAGTEVLGYYGISVAVPIRFRVGQAACSFPHEDSVSIATGEVFHCPMMTSTPEPDDAYTTVILAPSDQRGGHIGNVIRIDGVAAVRTDAAARGVARGSITVPSRGVSVSVRSPSHTTMRTILNTVRIAATDTRGCVDRTKPLTDKSNPQAGELVPGTPTGAVACQYDTSSRTLRLVGSRTLSAADIRLLQRVLASGTTGNPPALEHEGNSLVRYRLRYADGTTRDIDATLDLDPGTATDGRLTTTTTPDLPRALP